MSEKKNEVNTAAPEAAAKSNTITLDVPLKRGDQEITAVSVRRPAAGELRGLKLADVLQMDVSSLQVLLPRITSPALTAHDVAQMDPADLVQLATETAGFFMTKADRASLAA